MSGSAFAVTHHAFSSGAGRTSDGNGSHASTLKSPSYTKSVSWQHYRMCALNDFFNDPGRFYQMARLAKQDIEERFDINKTALKILTLANQK